MPYMKTIGEVRSPLIHPQATATPVEKPPTGLVETSGSHSRTKAASSLRWDLAKKKRKKIAPMKVVEKHLRVEVVSFHHQSDTRGGKAPIWTVDD